MYRWAEDKDKRAVMALWAADFESYEPYYSWYFSTVYRPEFTLCDFDGPRLAAMLQLAPYTLWLRGADLPVVYLVGVITDPDHRGQGRGHALLGEAQDRLAIKGYAAALLYTDVPGFYAPLGYRHCYKRQQLDLPGSMLAVFAAFGTGAAIWRDGSLKGDIPALSAIYQRMTACYEGYIRRGRDDWEKYLGEHNCDKAMLTLAEDRAYLLCVPEGEKLRIIELGFADTPCLTEALAQAARLALAAGLKGISWHAPLDVPGLLPLIPPGLWQACPFVMARLINVQTVLDALACPPAVRRILARLNTPDLTQLIFGVTGAPEECAGLDTKERHLLAESFPALPGWINEYT